MHTLESKRSRATEPYIEPVNTLAFPQILSASAHAAGHQRELHPLVSATLYSYAGLCPPVGSLAGVQTAAQTHSILDESSPGALRLYSQTRKMVPR